MVDCVCFNCVVGPHEAILTERHARKMNDSGLNATILVTIDSRARFRSKDFGLVRWSLRFIWTSLNATCGF